MLRKMFVLLLVWNAWVSFSVLVLAVSMLKFGGYAVELEGRVDSLERRVSAQTFTIIQLKEDTSEAISSTALVQGQVSIVAVAARSGWRHAERLIQEGIFDPIVFDNVQYPSMNTSLHGAQNTETLDTPAP